MHYAWKNNLFLARLLGISANLNENYRHYNFQAFANILSKNSIHPRLWAPRNIYPSVFCGYQVVYVSAIIIFVPLWSDCWQQWMRSMSISQRLPAHLKHYFVTSHLISCTSSLVVTDTESIESCCTCECDMLCALSVSYWTLMDTSNSQILDSVRSQYSWRTRRSHSVARWSTWHLKLSIAKGTTRQPTGGRTAYWWYVCCTLWWSCLFVHTCRCAQTGLLVCRCALCPMSHITWLDLNQWCQCVIICDVTLSRGQARMWPHKLWVGY